MGIGVPWPRAIALVDMNAFFASVEQFDHPEWRGLPVAVTNGSRGSTIITASYEARAFGIKTGTKLYEAKSICPQLIHAPSRPERYASVSTKIMNALKSVSPDIEVFSIDEAFVDLTNCQLLYDPIAAALALKKSVYDASGLHCSVGLSGDKTTAKFAAKQQKPNGFTVIHPQEAKQCLQSVPVGELCGIGPGITRFLQKYGVVYCGDMAKLPIGILAKRFGHLGRRLWYMCQGADPDPVKKTVAAPKSMGHGKVLPPRTEDDRELVRYFSHLVERLAARLRSHQLQASQFFIGMKTHAWGWLGQKIILQLPTQDAFVLLKSCQTLLAEHPHHGIVRQVQITALNPSSCGEQLDLFVNADDALTVKRQQLNKVKDQLATRYGHETLKPARHLTDHEMVSVIAPAWRPDGARQSITATAKSKET